MLRTECVTFRTLKTFLNMQFIRTDHNGIELSGSFALGSMGWAKWSDFYNSEITK